MIGLAAAGAVGGLLFGFGSSVINGAVDAIQSEFDLSAVVTGFAVASALLGCALGAELAGRQADRFGRIPVMVIGALEESETVFAPKGSAERAAAQSR